MKSNFMLLVLCLFSFGCFSKEDVKFTIYANDSANSFIVSATGQTDIGNELLGSWLKKAYELCGARKVTIEPNNGQPIVRDTSCSDAIKIKNGTQQCELTKASVFGKVLCETK